MKSNWGEWYWLVWLGIGFLIPEIFALFTNPANTLSETTWRWFGVIKNQSITAWGIQHYVLLAFMIWLFFHLVFRMFR